MLEFLNRSRCAPFVAAALAASLSGPLSVAAPLAAAPTVGPDPAPLAPTPAPAAPLGDQEELIAAYEGLYELLDGKDLEVKPRKGKNTAELLEARYGVGLTIVLREGGMRLDAKLAELRARVRTLVPGSQDEAARARLFGDEDELDAMRADALALIAVYEKPRQKEVDANRKAIEKAYEAYADRVDAQFDAWDELEPGEAWSIAEMLRRGDEVIELVNEVLDDRDEDELERVDETDTWGDDVVEGAVSLYSERGTFYENAQRFPETPHALEEFVWLSLLLAADRHVEVLTSTDLMTRRIDVEPTRFEQWLLRELRARAVEAFTPRAVHSSTEEEVKFTPIINEYRRGLGLELLTIDERLVIASRQHSQHQVDNGYFAHDAPDPRLRSPWDRARLEDYEGGIGENIAQGRHNSRSVFEAWYRSPGHHRNMVGRHSELGCAADSSSSIWTLMLGSNDRSWRNWHPDTPWSLEDEHGTPIERAAKSMAKGAIKEKVWKNDVLPVLGAFVDDMVRGVVANASRQDDGAWRDAIEAWDQFLTARTGHVVLENVAIMEVVDFAADSEDTGLRRAAEAFLRAHVSELAGDLDAVDAGDATWADVRRAWEDRARVQFKAGRSAS